MSDKTKIEWCDASWPVVTGCTHISEGCDHCYAARLTSGRLRNRPEYAGLAENGRFNGTVRCLPERLDWPFKWRNPRRIFVSDMADLFHDSVPDGFIARVWDVMGRSPQHTFQILTKRHGRMRSWVRRWASWHEADDQSWDMPPMPRGPDAVRATYTSGRARLFADMLDSMGEPPEGCAYPLYDWMEGQRWWPSVLPNVWLGVSAEDQKWANIRVPALLETPAAVRFVSAEPLLGPISLTAWLAEELHVTDPDLDAPDGAVIDGMERHGDCWTRTDRLHWLIAGGESGPGARPARLAWLRSLRDQCADVNVPFFCKQLGTVLGRELGAGPKGGDQDAWPDDLRIQEFPHTAECVNA